jgi:hypothetical protein
MEHQTVRLNRPYHSESTLHDLQWLSSVQIVVRPYLTSTASLHVSLVVSRGRVHRLLLPGHDTLELKAWTRHLDLQLRLRKAYI